MEFHARSWWRANKREIGRNVRAYGMAFAILCFVVILIGIFGWLLSLIPGFADIVSLVCGVPVIIAWTSIIVYVLGEFIKERGN